MPYTRMTEDDSCNEVEIFGAPFQGAGISGLGTEGVARALPSATMDQPFGLVPV